ncbi:pyocin knob domain-containing protein [Bacillus sp. FJAT-26390]|uniref:pyocin knob domain-containing protein n=1 Tax=Bacillus sp. FJAT-26390 TaxID=1743142 RepID=UPI0008081003|nr:pyocin knob domain-containing protein [Bacillus sp. FJAT-26390]OBZ13330.1 hypothetical protein A7975_10760 [Bacillus sp. FJAT-26390]
MAYTPRVWVDRAVATPNLYTKTGETASEVTLVAKPGTITQAGTPINAAAMNQLETGIQAAAANADKANTTILASPNLNTLTATGRYYCTTPTNLPLAGLNFYVDVININGGTSSVYCMQVAYSGADNRIWTRRNLNGTWTAWTQVSNETNTLGNGTNVNDIAVSGRFWANATCTNTPIVSTDFFIDHIQLDVNWARQTAYEFSTNRAWTRTKVIGVWTPWVALHQTFMVPSDTVIMSLPTEKATGVSVTVERFTVKHTGKYRLKGEYKAGGTVGSSTTIAAYVNGDRQAGFVQTTSQTYSAFSFDLEVVVTQGDFVNIQIQAGSTGYIRNVTLCGTEVYDNPFANVAAYLI